MDIQKVFKSGHPYLCKESVQAFNEWPGSENLRTFTDLVNICESQQAKAHMRLALANSDQNDSVYKWIARIKDIANIYELAVLGGDLHPTDEWRVVQGNSEFRGTKKECMNYLRGSHLTFKKDGEIVTANDDWDKCIDSEGRVAYSLEYMFNDAFMERRYYDAVDDFEIWHSV